MRLTLDHEGKRYTYEVRKEITTVGRDPNCDIALPTATVSRFHAQLVREGDELKVKNLGSRNGIFVNGARVEEAKLRSGDEIRLGKIQMRFEADPQGSVPKGFQAEAAPMRVGEAGAGVDQPTPLDLQFSPEEARKIEAPLGAGRRAAAGGKAARGPVGWLVALGARWKLAVALFLAVDILAFAAWLATRHTGPEEPERKPLSAQERAEALERVAQLLEKGRDLLPKDRERSRRHFADCRERLKRLQEERPDDAVASRLSRILDWWEPVDSAYANFPWDSYRRIVEVLSDLSEGRRTPALVQEMARSWSEWLIREVGARQAFLALDPLLEPSAPLVSWEKAYAELQKCDRQSLFWGAYEKRLPELKNRIARSYLDQAERSYRRREWAEALRLLDQADSWEALERSPGLRSRSEMERKAQGDLSAAREALAAGQEAEAARLARGIPPESQFASEVPPILEEISRREAKREVLALFQSGEAGGALAKLREGPYRDDALLRLILKVQTAWAAALEAQDRLDFNEAILKAGEVLSLLSDPVYQGNQFRTEAEDLGERWTDASARAERFYQEGKAFEAKRKFADAYLWWARARKEDPEGDWAGSEIQRHREQAQRWLNEALQIKSQDPEAAIRRLRQAVELVEPGSPLERRIREEMDRIGAH